MQERMARRDGHLRRFRFRHHRRRNHHFRHALFGELARYLDYRYSRTVSLLEYKQWLACKIVVCSHYDAGRRWPDNRLKLSGSDWRKRRGTWVYFGIEWRCRLSHRK